MLWMTESRDSRQVTGIRGKWFALLACALMGSAWANEPAQPEVQLLAEVRSATHLKPAINLEEGQEVFYTLRIRNPGTTPMTTVSVVQAVPRNTYYVASSATGAGADITFSADGGLTFAQPSQLKSVGNPGKALPPSQYTHIRWQFGYSLAPKTVILARFRAVFR